MRTTRDRSIEIGAVKRIRSTSTLLMRLCNYLPPKGHDYIADALRDKAIKESKRFRRERTELLRRKPGRYIIEGARVRTSPDP